MPANNSMLKREGAANGKAIPTAMTTELNATGSLRLPILSEIGPDAREVTKEIISVIKDIVEMVAAASALSSPMYFCTIYS